MDEELKYAIENGIVDIDAIRGKIEMNKRNEYLRMHKYGVFLGADGSYHTTVPDMTKKDGRRAIKRKTKESLENAIIEYYKNAETKPTFEVIFRKWIDSKLKYGEIEKQTADRYEIDFYRFFAEIKNYKISSFSESTLEDFIKTSIREKNLTAKGWSNLRLLINGMFKYAKKQGYTQISITHFMGDLDLPRKSFRRNIKTSEESIFTDAEIDKIMGYINSVEPSIVNLGIVLAFQAGLRAGELSALKWNDLKGNVLSVNKTEIRYKNEDGHYVYEVRDFTKGEIGHRKVILTGIGVKAIKRAHMLNPFGEYLFMEDGERIKGKAFTAKIKKICRYVDIKPRSIHKARKTYGTKLLNAGLNEKIIENQMGHTDIGTTKGYYWFNNSTEEEIKNLVSNALK